MLKTLTGLALMALLFSGGGCSCDEAGDTRVSGGDTELDGDTSDTVCDICGDVNLDADADGDASDADADVPPGACELETICPAPHVLLAHNFDADASLIGGACGTPTCEGECPVATAGPVGEAGAFSGGGLKFSTTREVPSAALTLKLWVRQSAPCVDEGILVAARFAGAHRWTLGCSAGTDTLTWSVAQGDGRSATQITAPAMADGQWHHVVATRDGLAGSIALFVDGRRVAWAPTGLTGSARTPSNIYVGTGVGGELPFIGELDEIVVLDRAQGLAELELERLGEAHTRGVCAPACVGSTCTAATCDDLVAHFTLDEAAAPYSAGVPGAADAACSGACPDPTEGIIGGAQTFDGDTTGLAAEASPGVDFGPTAGFTWMAWLRGSRGFACDAGGLQTDEVVLGRGGGTTGASWRLGCQLGTARPLFELCDRFGDCFKLVGSEPIIDGTWHLASARFDGVSQTLSLEVDGRVVDRRPASIGTLIDGPEVPVRIGWHGDQFDSRFHGDVDDVQLHGARLDAPTLRTLAEAGRAGAPPCEASVEPATLRITAEDLSAGGFVYGDLGAFAASDDVRTFTLPPGPYDVATFSVGQDVQFICDEPIVTGSAARMRLTLRAGADVTCRMLSGMERTCPSGTSHLITLDDGAVGDAVSASRTLCLGACPTPIDSPLGGAGHFDGLGINLTSSNADWAHGDSFTLSYWIRKTVDSPLTQHQTAIGRSDPGVGLAWWTGLWSTPGSQGHVAFSLLGPGGEGSAETILTSRTSVIDGLWHHVVAVRDAREHQTRLYVDGTLEAVGTFVFDSGFAASTDINIGHLAGAARLTGDLDEVTIHRRALPAAEIRYQAATGPAGIIACRP